MIKEIQCDMCGNEYGNQRRVDVKLDGPVRHINICQVCGQDKTDLEIFKIVYPKKFKSDRVYARI